MSETTHPTHANATNRRVVIAGAGDVGMRLAHLRAALGDRVVALRRSPQPGAPGIESQSVDIVTGRGLSAVPAHPDVLVLCAAPDRRDEATYRALFIDGSRRLIKALAPARVVFVSSTAVYATDDGSWVTEDSPTDASAFNGRVLIDAEKLVRQHSDAVILRLSGLYGPGRERMLRRAAEVRAASLRWTNRIHVEDAAAALSLLIDLESPASLYCGSDELPATEHDVVDWVRVAKGLPRIPALDEPPSGKRVCNRLLRAAGWAPMYPDYRVGYCAMLAQPRE